MTENRSKRSWFLFGCCIFLGILFWMMPFHKAVLFRIEFAFQDDLNDKGLNAPLRQAFEAQGIQLAPDASVSVEAKDSEWVIIDPKNQRKYFISKASKSLNISPLPPKGWYIFAVFSL